MSGPQTDSNRYRMLAEVRRVWIDGYLKDSLHNVVRVELGLEEKPDALSRPWDMIVQQPNRAPQPLPPSRSMVEVFDKLGQALLILGAPGSGKTTLLLELTRDLLYRAQQDASHPIPVVFHLSSWAAMRRPLRDWFIDELSKRYYVPRKLAGAWIDAEQVLPLLDGLDEVAPEHRESCVEAINAFRREHPLVPLAVCSRAAEYEALRVRMGLSGAVMIQPLSRSQIRVYLNQAGKSLAGVRTVLREDETLWELLETPLMLSIIALAYHGRSASEVRATGSLEQRRAHLFENYSKRMFERRSKVTAYTREQTLRWLTWLARSLIRNNLSVFYLEWMQPDWLPSRAQRCITIIVPPIFPCLAGVLLGSMGTGLILGWFAVGLAAGLRFGLAAGLRFGLLFGIPAGLLIGLIDLVGKKLSRHPLSKYIEPVETLRWSWTKALVTWTKNPFELGMILAAILGIGLFGLNVGLLSGLLLFVMLTLLGFTLEEIPTRTTPNEGIRRSMRNALVVFLIFGLLGGVFAGLAGAMLCGGRILVGGVPIGGGPICAMPGGGLVLVVIGGLFAGISIAMLFGGSAYLQHHTMRILLWRNGYAPLNYVPFLNYAAERVFLRKVGGGYIFTHRLLMEYFATLQPADEARETKTA